jgi:tetratricopeptide (TPR) repeat protein
MLMNARGFASPDVEENYSLALALVQRAGESPELFPVLEGLQSYYAVSGPLTTAHRLSQQMMQLAERTRDPTMQLEAHHVMGADLVRLARLDEARDHLERVLALYDDVVAEQAFRWCGHDARVCCQAYLGLCRWHGGSPDRALAECESALAHARSLRQPASLAQALFMVAWLHLQLFDSEAAAAPLEELAALSESEGLPYWHAMTQFFLAWAMALRGQLEPALAALEKGRVLCSALGARVGAVEYRMIAADLSTRRGEPAMALALLEEAAACHAEAGERYLQADILMLQALARQKRRGPDDARATVACLCEAIDFARAHGLRPAELRAALLLSYHWEMCGERQRARDTLARSSSPAGDVDLPEARLIASRLRDLTGSV